MFLGKSKQLKQSPKKSTLDQVLWFVENYLPNKKHQAQCAICKLAVVIRPSHAGWRIVISPPATESEAEEVEVEVEVEGESAPAPA